MAWPGQLQETDAPLEHQAAERKLEVLPTEFDS